MRLIDADKLPVSKTGKLEMVLLEDIKKAPTVKCQLAPKKTIDIKWLQQRMADAIGKDYSDERLDSKYFLLINKFIAEYEEEQNAD